MPESYTSQTQFIDFLIHIAQEGYASDAADIKKLDDGSQDLILEKHEFCFHDNWFGGEPFGGREVVSKDGKVFWMAVYYGGFTKDRDEGTKALREALKQPDRELPVRGPKDFIASNGFRYQYSWQGDLGRFDSTEKIYNPNDELVYKAEISGGLVDQ